MLDSLSVEELFAIFLFFLVLVMEEETKPIERTFGKIAPEDQERLDKYYQDILDMEHSTDVNEESLQKFQIYSNAMKQARLDKHLSRRIYKKATRLRNTIVDLYENPLAREKALERCKMKLERAKNLVVNFVKHDIVQHVTEFQDKSVDYFTHAKRENYLEEHLKMRGYKKGTNVVEVAKDLDMDGKTAVITGGTSDIGKEVARGLALAGARVVLIARNPLEASHIVEKMRKDTNNDNIYFTHFSLNGIMPIMEAIQEMEAYKLQPDIIINMMAEATPSINIDTFGASFDKSFGTSFIAPFMFTELFLHKFKSLDDMKPVRIINVTCGAHKMSNANIEDLSLERLDKFKGLNGYAFAKLGNVAHALDLDNRLKKAGVQHISINAINPGLADTKLFDNSYILTPLRFMLRHLGLLQQPDVAAAPILYLAGDEALKGVSGKYFESFHEKKPIRKLRWKKFLERWEEFGWEIGEKISIVQEDFLLEQIKSSLKSKPRASTEQLISFAQKRVEDLVQRKSDERKLYLKKRLEESGVNFEELLPEGTRNPLDIEPPPVENGPEIAYLYPGLAYESQIYIPPYEEIRASRESFIGPREAPVPLERIPISENNKSLVNDVKELARKKLIKEYGEGRDSFEYAKNFNIDADRRYYELMLKMEQKRIIDTNEKRKAEEEELEVDPNRSAFSKKVISLWNALKPY